MAILRVITYNTTASRVLVSLCHYTVKQSFQGNWVAGRRHRVSSSAFTPVPPAGAITSHFQPLLTSKPVVQYILDKNK